MKNIYELQPAQITKIINENSIINCPAFQDVCDYGDQLDLKIRNILSARKRLSSILEVKTQKIPTWDEIYAKAKK